MYGDEFLPKSNRDRCNPLYRINNSEWVNDKIERKESTKEIKKEQETKRIPIYKREEMIKIIENLQKIHQIRELIKS